MPGWWCGGGAIEPCCCPWCHQIRASLPGCPAHAAAESPLPRLPRRCESRAAAAARVRRVARGGLQPMWTARCGCRGAGDSAAAWAGPPRSEARIAAGTRRGPSAAAALREPRGGGGAGAAGELTALAPRPGERMRARSPPSSPTRREPVHLARYSRGSRRARAHSLWPLLGDRHLAMPHIPPPSWRTTGSDACACLPCASGRDTFF